MPDQPEKKPGGKFSKRYAVVLFADLVGCSEISNEHSVEEYSKILHQFYLAGHLAYRAVNRLRPGCFDENNSFFKYAGDEVCSFLLLPDSDRLNMDECQKRIEQALRYSYALKFFWYLSEYNLIRVREQLAPREIGIGVHFGPIAICDKPPPLMGSERKTDIEGYAINLAKRIEGSSHDALATRIFISGECRAVVADPKSLNTQQFMEESRLGTEKVEISAKNISTIKVVYELRPKDELDKDDQNKCKKEDKDPKSAKEGKSTSEEEIIWVDKIAGSGEEILKEKDIKVLYDACRLDKSDKLKTIADGIRKISEEKGLYPDNYWLKVISKTIPKYTPERFKSENEDLIKARILLDESVFENALPYFEKLVTDIEIIDNKDLAFEVHFSLGYIYDKLKRYEKAIGHYEMAYKLAPNDPVTLVNWGATLSNLNNQIEAIEKYGKADKLRPNHPDTLLNWGVALSCLGKKTEAIEKFKKADKFRPNDPDILMNWGAALYESGNVDDALDKTNRAYLLARNNSVIIENYIEYLYAAGRRERAEDLAKKHELNLREVVPPEIFKNKSREPKPPKKPK